MSQLATRWGDLCYVTLPYADDFCLTTTDLRTHRKLIDDNSDKITYMGMKIKPSKCRSLSICSEMSQVIPFYIGDFLIPSIQDEEKKFLGKLLFYFGKALPLVMILNLICLFTS